MSNRPFNGACEREELSAKDMCSKLLKGKLLKDSAADK